MSWHVVRLADVAATHWRNGGGLTRELAAEPAGLEWQWRLSVAEVAADGPFSRFDGAQRWFAVLQGDGVQLDITQGADVSEPATRRHRLTPTDPPLCFDGGQPTHCQLLGGPTQDFNLMLRQGRGSARMQRVNGRLHAHLDAPKTIAAYAHSTGASVLFGNELLSLLPFTLAWRTVSGTAPVQIDADHALWMEIPL